MSKQVFFSFDFSEDLWRATVVRNRWLTDPVSTSPSFWDPAFATGSPPSREALERFVNSQIEGAEVTAVLIGAHTASHDHVLYAIRRSAELGRALLGIYINGCKNRYGSTSARGPNPFDLVTIKRDDREVRLSSIVPTYDWIADDGFRCLEDWIAEAVARSSARP